MKILPKKYKMSIISMFGTIGETWLENLDKIINKYIEKFNLTNVKVHDELTMNLILYAHSEEFGEVVVKIGFPLFEELLIRETRSLENFDGNGVCRCYYFNLEDGVRILERLIPGRTLHTIEKRTDRIEAFCDLLLRLNVKSTKFIQLPTYREILDRSIKQSIEQPDKYKVLEKYIDAANELYKEIESRNLSKHLLHADLHHDNILISNKGIRAIDPHGFIGEKVLETARFIENEIQKKEINEENILEVISLIGAKIDEPEELICQSLFIDYVLSTCWDIETNASKEHINDDINNLKLVNNVLFKLGSLNKGRAKTY